MPSSSARAPPAEARRFAVSYTHLDVYKRQIRRGAAAVIWTNQGAKKALPIIEDGIVPIDKLTIYLEHAYKLFKKYNIKIATWGHAGNANMHIQPFLDLSNMRDRAKVFAPVSYTHLDVYKRQIVV